MAFAEYPVVSSSGSGGITKVADSIERNALTPADGDIVIQLDNDFLYEWNGSSWAVLADRTWQTAGSILGAKTFDTASRWSVATNQQVFGVTNTITVNYAAPSANRVYTVPDVGADAAYVMTAGNQTIGGTKTFSSTISGSISGNAGTVTNGAYVNVGNVFTLAQSITASSNQLVLYSGVNQLTLNSGTSAAARTYTVPDTGTTDTFAMLGGPQSFTGAKTFSSTITATNSSAPLTLNVGSSSNAELLFTSSATQPDLYINFRSTGTGPQSWLLGLNPSGISSNAFGLWDNTAGAPIFTIEQTTNVTTYYANVTINNASNQLSLSSSVNLLNLNSGTSAAARTYTFPDVGTTGTFAMLQGSQTFTGLKTFSSGLAISGGSAANNTIWVASNVLNIRGGTSGTDIYNTSGNVVVDITDAGVVTLGQLATTADAGQAVIINGGLSTGATGTGSAERRLLLNANTYGGVGSTALPSRNSNGGTLGGAVLRIAARTSDTENAFQFATNLIADSNTTATTTIANGSQAGAWTFPIATTHTFGNSSGAATTAVVVDAANTQQRDVIIRSGGTTHFGLRVNTSNACYLISNSQTINFSGDAGTTVHGSMTSAGAWTLGPSSNAGNLTHTIRIGNNGTVPCVTIQNTAADSVALRFTGTSNSMDIAGANGQLYCNGVFGKTSTAGITVLVNASHNWGTTTSIREAKTNIQPLGSTLGWLTQLKTYTYQFRKQVDGQYTDEAEEFVTTGLMYDEVVQVNPGLCFELADGTPSGVEYTRLITPMLRAIQELHAELQAAKAEIALLRGV